MKIEFGLLAPPLHEQLGISEEEGKLLQDLSRAVSILTVHAIITQAEAHKARLRLVKKIEKELAKLNKG